MEALANYYGGLGNTRLPMRASVVAMVLNVAGNWLLIDGHLGAPAMGVRGAALASALSTGVAFLGLLAVFLLERRPADGRWPRLRAAEFLRMLRFGVPSGLNWFFEFAAFMFFVNVVVAGLGTTALASLMAVVQLNSVAFMPAFALASAAAILVGQSNRRWTEGRGPPPGQARVRGRRHLAGAGRHPLPRRSPPDLRPVRARGLLVGRAARRRGPDAGLLCRLAALRRRGGRARRSRCERRETPPSCSGRGSGPAGSSSCRDPGSRSGCSAEGTSPRWPGSSFYLGLLAVVLLLRFRSGAWRRLELVEPTA